MGKIDHEIFLFINRELAHPVLDAFFPFITDFQKTAVFYLLMFYVLAVLLVRKNKKALLVIVGCCIGVLFSDFINGQLLKPLFERARPPGGILRTDFHGSYAFPSSHAVDVFFIAMFLSLFYPRLRISLFVLAALTAFSRVYCGVHYPGDVLGGALVGCALGIAFYKGMAQLMTSRLKYFLSFACLLFCQFSFALEDPTKGKPFLPWLWEDQFKPTLVKSYDKTGLMIAGSAAASVLAVHQYDGKIYDFNNNGGNILIGRETAEHLGKLGNGGLGLALIGTQLFFDQGNGLKSARALILTSVSHITMAAVFQRSRPNNRSDFLPFPSSFPSGHTSSAFAFAGSLAYSYGWAGAVPGYLLATAIGVSRIKENRHWASDIVGGAFLGTFWARASFRADEKDTKSFTVIPMPIYDGAMITAMKEF